MQFPMTSFKARESSYNMGGGVNIGENGRKPSLICKKNIKIVKNSSFDRAAFSIQPLIHPLTLTFPGHWATLGN